MKNPPAVIINRKSSDKDPSGPLWLRLSAFLSMRSPKTQETYLGIINEWCRFLKAEPGTEAGAKTLLSVNDLHAIGYKNWLEKRPGEKPRSRRQETKSSERQVQTQRYQARKKEGLEATLSNATIAKKFAALRRIYRMFIASSLGISENPFDTDRVPPPARESGRKRPTEMMDFKLVKKVINSADESEPKGLRDKAILAALFGGGLRRSEVANLRVGDVKRSPGGALYLYLRSTKAKKDAEQALPTWAAAIIQRLHAERLESGAGGGDYLFISYTGKGGNFPSREQVSASGIYKLFKYYCRKADVKGFITPHSARATAITKLLADGISHRKVQQFSRHSSIQMVEVYDKRRLSVDENPAKDLDFED